MSSQGAASERYAGAGQAVGTGADASLHRDAAGPDVEEEVQLPDRAEGVGEITIAPGKAYAVTEADLEGGEGQAWRKIARDHGMHENRLIPFNQHIASVEVDGALANEAVTPQLVQGASLYIPSAEELAFADCRQKADSYEAAVQLYGELASGSQIKIINAARDRASGRKGESYGTKGVDGPTGGAGVFLTQNKDLAGASRRRSEKIDGQREYRINWNASHDGFWKCSVFLHDSVFQAGYTPDMTGNDHYRLAGQLHESSDYTEISHTEAGPGSLWQRFGGRGSDESHNAVLSSFVDVTSIDDTQEKWDFSIIGAETDRAAESERSHTITKGTNENTSGKKIRFFKPKGS